MGLNLLKGIRSYKGYKQYEMADMIGMSRQTYNYKENGKSNFTLEDIAIISKYLSLDLNQVNEIFFENEISK